MNKTQKVYTICLSCNVLKYILYKYRGLFSKLQIYLPVIEIPKF